MRVMAIDYGDAHIGIAVSDMLGMITGEAWIMDESDMERAADKITVEIKNRSVNKIILGYPKNMDGTLGPRAEKSREFAEILKMKTGLDVLLWDERRTTVDAHRILSEMGRHGKKRKSKIDAVAASLILEGYLNSTL
jgi:putative Holliday junction resolvase